MAPRSTPRKRPTTADAYYFAFSAKDWRSSESVRLMPLDARGAFIDLLAVSWLASEEPCSIPSGDAEIAALLGVSVDEWKRVAPRVLAEFDETTKSGRLRNARLWKEYQGMKQARRKMSQGGKASALRRRDDHGRLLPAPDQAPTKHLGKVAGKVASGSQSQSQSQVTTPAPRAKRDGESGAKYPNLSKAHCDELHTLWLTTFGHVEYPAFRKAIGPLFEPPLSLPFADVKVAMQEAIRRAETEGRGGFLNVHTFAQKAVWYVGEAKGRRVVDPVTGTLLRAV